MDSEMTNNIESMGSDEHELGYADEEKAAPLVE